MKFRLRVDEKDAETSDKFKNLLKGYTHVLVRHELPHGNPHYHAYVDMPSKTSCPAMRYTIDQLFDVAKTDRSVKKCDDDKVDLYVQYLFNEKKGNVWKLISHTFDVDLHVERAKAVAEAFAEAKEKKQIITEWDMCQELKSMIENDPDVTEHKIIEMAIAVRNKYEKPFNDHVLARQVQTAIAGLPRWGAYVRVKVHERVFRA